jgi:hypothetical protein
MHIGAVNVTTVEKRGVPICLAKVGERIKVDELEERTADLIRQRTGQSGSDNLNRT